jgi:hypothetical protein
MTDLAAHITKPYDLAKIMARNPDSVGKTLSFAFYEHPTMGDEAPLIISNGKECGLSHYWEVPSIEEMGYSFGGGEG